MEHSLISPVEISINRDKINDPNISTLSTHSPLAASLMTYRLSIQTQTQGIQTPLSLATPQFNPNSSSHNKLLSSLHESSPSNIPMDTPTARDHVTRYFNNSNGIIQSEIMFEKLKVTKLKNDLLDDLRVEIKDIIKKELESLHTIWTCSATNYITEIEALKRELDIKERMIAQLLNTLKEIFTVNIAQSAKPGSVFTCESETKANNISGMKTNQSGRKRSIDVISNGNIVTNNQALKLSLSEQMKNVKCQKKEDFDQFK